MKLLNILSQRDLYFKSWFKLGFLYSWLLNNTFELLKSTYMWNFPPINICYTIRLIEFVDMKPSIRVIYLLQWHRFLTMVGAGALNPCIAQGLTVHSHNLSFNCFMWISLTFTSRIKLFKNMQCQAYNRYIRRTIQLERS